jgi:hypothetical protein
MGGTLTVPRGRDVRVTIRVRQPQVANANGDQPKLARVDLIRGTIARSARDRANDRNSTTRVERRFGPQHWRNEGDYLIIDHIIRGLAQDSYIRVRGTNTEELEPQPDPNGEDPWQDLWFYGNPIFLRKGE